MDFTKSCCLTAICAEYIDCTDFWNGFDAQIEGFLDTKTSANFSNLACPVTVSFGRVVSGRTIVYLGSPKASSFFSYMVNPGLGFFTFREQRNIT